MSVVQTLKAFACGHEIADEQREDDGPTKTAVFTEMRRDR